MRLSSVSHSDSLLRSISVLESSICKAVGTTSRYGRAAWTPRYTGFHLGKTLGARIKFQNLLSWSSKTSIASLAISNRHPRNRKKRNWALYLVELLFLEPIECFHRGRTLRLINTRVVILVLFHLIYSDMEEQREESANTHCNQYDILLRAAIH